MDVSVSTTTLPAFSPHLLSAYCRNVLSYRLPGYTPGAHKPEASHRTSCFLSFIVTGIRRQVLTASQAPSSLPYTSAYLTESHHWHTFADHCWHRPNPQCCKVKCTSGSLPHNARKSNVFSLPLASATSPFGHIHQFSQCLYSRSLQKHQQTGHENSSLFSLRSLALVTTAFEPNLSASAASGSLLTKISARFSVLV
jgi:hypothetical protein